MLTVSTHYALERIYVKRNVLSARTLINVTDLSIYDDNMYFSDVILCARQSQAQQYNYLRTNIVFYVCIRRILRTMCI